MAKLHWVSWVLELRRAEGPFTSVRCVLANYVVHHAVLSSSIDSNGPRLLGVRSNRVVSLHSQDQLAVDSFSVVALLHSVSSRLAQLSMYACTAPLMEFGLPCVQLLGPLLPQHLQPL